MMRLLSAERIKARHTWVLPLTIIGPAGVTLLGVLVYALRWNDYLREASRQQGAWTVLSGNMFFLLALAMLLGVTLLSSMVFDVDHRSEMWKQLFALPLSRAGIYIQKYALVAGLILLAAVLGVVGMIGIWLGWRMGALPWARLGTLLGLMWVSALPLVAIQSALSAHIRNQAVSITVGVAGIIVALMLASGPEWIPWAMPMKAVAYAQTGIGHPVQLVAFALAWTAAFVAVGAAAFARRDVR